MDLSQELLEKYIFKNIKEENKFDIPFKKNEILKQLNRMACLELYVGNNPYKGKETLQTIVREFSLEKARKEGEAPFPIKFCISRFTDMYYAAHLFEMESLKALDQKVHLLEKLAVILSNIVCRINTENTGKHPAFVLHENAFELTFQQIQQITTEDRALITELLSSPL